LGLVNWIFTATAVGHVGLAGIWLGSMLYSLFIVQPRATRFFGTDDDGLEAFMTELGAGNRRPVLAMIAGLAATGVALPVLQEPEPADVAWYSVEAAFVMAAAVAFANVTWRLWPGRTFALAHERRAYRHSFRKHAIGMVLLVGAAFASAVANLASP
jgi:hypothetical protein